MPKTWQELRLHYSQSDGLPTRDADAWTEDKLFFWNQYIGITTKSMVGHPKWPEGLVYVDLFAGPGICEIRQSGHRFPGSTLIAAYAPKAFKSILACELDANSADALETRLGRTPAAKTSRVFRGDCNDRIQDIASEIPVGALTLAFIDPEGLHVWFETIRTLAKQRRADLLILFADYMDIVRNVDRYYAQKDSNLDKMFGPSSTWRQQWPQLINRTPQNICRMFADEFQVQLQQLGYVAFREKVISAPNGPIYRLIFASKHPLGAEFWDEITKHDRSGQSGLFGST